MAAPLASSDAGLAILEIVLLIVAEASAGLFCAYDAKRNGRNPIGWFFVGLIPVAGVVIWLVARGPRPLGASIANARPSVPTRVIGCPSCGSLQAPAFGFCPACGAERAHVAASPDVHAMAPRTLKRPIGVVILAAWQLLQGLAYVTIGILVSRNGPSVLTRLGIDPATLPGANGILAPLFMVIGALLLAWGLLILRGPGWVWVVTVSVEWLVFTVSILSALGNAASLVSALGAALILWYLYRPHVRAWFARRRLAALAAAPPP